ncbi:MAG: acyl-CoA dehydrogenase family protein [Deltaproteobacteria bacterium]|nr:acyl-CoA dehydrogenase family protein [Deltaproteobacteria bacterium]
MFSWNDSQKLLMETVSHFAKTELASLAHQIDEEEGFNDSALRKMGELGLLGVTAEEKFGGAGLGCVEATLVMEKLAEHCASTTLSYLAHSILCVNNLNENASEIQKTQYLPGLIQGAQLGGMGMTEPEAGSDSLGMRAKAVKKGDRYFLNGTKTFITNGPVADVFVVYAKTGSGRKDISTFIVEKNFRGFKVGKRLHKLGMRGSPTSELILENCEVPECNRIGGENESVQHMMRNLNIERITISGISLGVASAALNYSVRYAKERQQFGKPIADFQMIQEKIAEMATSLDAGRALTYSMALEFDRGNREDLSLGGRAKLFTAQMATRICLEAVQILGGYGYTKEYPVERYLRDAKLMEIGAGTNEIMRILIARKLLTA